MNVSKKLGGSPARFTQAEVIAAITDNKGIVTAAAAALKCSPKTIYNYALRYAEVRQVLADSRVKMFEKALSTVLEAMESQDEAIKLKASIWFLNSMKALAVIQEDPYTALSKVAQENQPRKELPQITDDYRDLTSNYFTELDKLRTNITTTSGN